MCVEAKFTLLHTLFCFIYNLNLISATNTAESEYEGFNVVLDEPYDGAIYVRSIHDPPASGIVDPTGRFTVRFHVECSRPIKPLAGFNLQGQLNSAWIHFGVISLSCGHKYSSAVENAWPPASSKDAPSDIAEFTRRASLTGRASVLSGPNSFGLFVTAQDGFVSPTNVGSELSCISQPPPPPAQRLPLQSPP